MFGAEIGKSLLDYDLQTEADFVNFAKVVFLKVEHAPTRKYMTTFVNSLLQQMNDKLRNEDLQEIQDKTTVLINNKIKAEKGKDNKKKKGPVIKVNTQTKGGLYDLVKEENKDEGSDDEDGYEYRGKHDEFDFM